MDEPRTHHLDDPRAMRALAHPLRLRALGQLRHDGPATATMLAERLDEAPALMSYHLRQLAAHGFIEEAPELARDGREHWWRAAAERTSWSTADFLDSPERRAALNALRREVYRRYDERLGTYLSEETAWGEDWVDAAGSSDYVLELDPDGLRALSAELSAVLDRYQREPPQPAGTPEHVAVIFHAFPVRRST